MLIDTNGNIMQAWVRGDGPIVKDKAESNPYNIDFAIAVRYSNEQKQAFSDIWMYKQYLKSTDYKAIKYAEGAISEEEYAPIKAERARARETIRQLEFDDPTLTKEQIVEAERKAMQKKGGTIKDG